MRGVRKKTPRLKGVTLHRKPSYARMYRGGEPYPFRNLSLFILKALSEDDGRLRDKAEGEGGESKYVTGISHPSIGRGAANPVSIIVLSINRFFVFEAEFAVNPLAYLDL